MNDMIRKPPADVARFTKQTRAVNDIKFLTAEEQQESLDQAVRLFESNRVSDIKVHAEMA